jgi:transcriptional regulator with XRE-family HTH domain
MQSKKQTLLPKFQKIFEQMGENIKLARKRRNLTTIQVAERAGLDRSTLYHMEKEIQAFLWVLILMCLEY